ncbi:hypothetical protein WH50_00035 [Pokkaliibacter plantistimulans]|uniref:Transcriptional regulator n=2 Tax=Pseudomonadota TaxID=1224 RepID=A0ABX5M8C6_9GAMM|nr:MULTISPECIES: hypothetical protein [Pokkaliibacter]MDH2435161.1 hypothetical protein [Pokkaliibacter sp. MBI-7]PPC77171.1 hypothetical protein C4K68_12230 [Pokkaliibacter plantistimulans]PXF33150.1 hypothetical protein WH50_00035 [Pokkaliibacter plantistimulans]
MRRNKKIQHFVEIATMLTEEGVLTLHASLVIAYLMEHEQALMREMIAHTDLSRRGLEKILANLASKGLAEKVQIEETIPEGNTSGRGDRIAWRLSSTFKGQLGYRINLMK